MEQAIVRKPYHMTGVSVAQFASHFRYFCIIMDV